MKQNLLMLLIIGLMITACKKDEDSPTPASSARVVTMQMKTNNGYVVGNLTRSGAILNEVYINNFGTGPIDTLITFREIKDSTAFFFGYHVVDSGRFKLIVDGVTRIDTMLYDDDLTFDFRYNYLLNVYP